MILDGVSIFGYGVDLVSGWNGQNGLAFLDGVGSGVVSEVDGVCEMVEVGEVNGMGEVDGVGEVD